MPITHATTTGIIGEPQWNEAHDISLFTPSEIGAVAGSGVAGRVAEFSTSDTVQAANLIAPSANILTLTNAAASTLALNITSAKTLTLTASDDYTLTIPATGTAALLARDQDFTGVNKFYRGAVTSNTFLGGAGNATLTGGSNIGIGNNNQTLLSTGANNVGVGNFALRNVTTGSQNFGIGYGALENIQDALNNVALGFNALQNNVSGLGNIGVGHSALNKAKDIRNTAVGYLAGRELTSGARCIFLGSNSGLNQTTLSNLLIIDSQARVSAAVELTNAILYGVMGANPSDQTLRINAVQTIAVNTTTTNAPLTVFDLNAYVSTAATGFANGGGVRQTFTGETATDGTSQLMANITSTWVDATNATRKAKLSLSAYDTAARLGMEIEASGTAPMIGFFGVAPVVRPTALTAADAGVVNSGDATTDGVINNIRTRVGELETKLQALGLLT